MCVKNGPTDTIPGLLYGVKSLIVLHNSIFEGALDNLFVFLIHTKMMFWAPSNIEFAEFSTLVKLIS